MNLLLPPSLAARAAGLLCLAALLPCPLPAQELVWHGLVPPAGVTAGGVAEMVADVANAGAEPWGEAHFLIARDAAGQTLAVADLAGTEPGQRVRRTLRFPAPPVAPAHTVIVQALEQDVAWFGEPRRVTFAVLPRPPYLGMQLSATTFDALAPARLSTTDAVTSAAPYRLRAKVIDGSRWGWHAANLWNRNGEPLDNPPPPGVYPECVLYWVRYHGFTGAVLEIGPERRTAITVAGAVSLASQWFHASQPPRITSTENFAGTPYRLLATFRDELGFTWETSPGFNNHGQPLTNLPPPGTYQVTLQWRRYDASLRLASAGPAREVTVTITDGPQPVLEVAGVITGEPVWDDALGDWSAELAVVRHAFSVPVPGVLRVRATAVTGGEMLLNVQDAAGTPLRSGSGGLELPVTPGTYALTLTADHETDFSAAAELFPYALAPRLAGTEAVSARVNVPLAIAAVSATGAAPIEFSAARPGEPNGLPAGLRLEARTGELTGTPTTPGTYRVWVTARNAAGAAGRWLTVTVVPRYPPVIVWQGMEGPESGALRPDWSTALAARLEAPAAGLAPPTGRLTYTAERIPPGGGLPVALAVPAELPVTLTALTGELRVTARYAGDADYEPATRTVSFVVPDRTPPVPPLAPGFQANAVGSTGFALAWAPFADGAGASGGRPAQGITYEVELDLGARRVTTAVPAVSFNGLAPGSTHHVRVRARDTAGNVSGWLAGGFSVALPDADPAPGTGPVWLDVNGDGIRDELIPPGPAFSWFAAEAYEDWVRYTEWTWARVPELGLSWAEGWSLYIGGSWQLVPDEQIHEVHLIRPGFHFLARPGYDYTVSWQVGAPPGGALPRRIAFFPAAEFAVPGPGAESVAAEMLAAEFFPAAALHAFPPHLVRLGRPLATAAWRGRVVNLGLSRGGGGILPAVLGAGGGLRIDLSDAIGGLLELGPRVAWEVWDGITQIAGGLGAGGTVELGLTTTGRFQLGLRLDDTTTVWCTLDVAPAPTGTLRVPERIWINDDDDAGSAKGTDIPGQGAPDHADAGPFPGRVDGTRDLVDFFPVSLLLRELVAAYPPAAGFNYRLSQADGAVAFAYTSLTGDQAELCQERVLTTGFGDDFARPPGEAATRVLTAEGIALSRSFIEMAGRPGGAVLLVEGRRETRAPLRLTVRDGRGEVVATLEAPLRVVPVERMYRVLNLRSTARNANGSPHLPSLLGPGTTLGDPGEAWPDVLTHGRHLLWIHGFSIDGEEARGWASETFKRLHRLGSRARFVAVLWPGDTGFDYHQSVFHAFQAGDALAPALAAGGIGGDIAVLAHSLGNLVASQAIAAGGLAVSRYLMLNAAVPAEAYDANPEGSLREQAAPMTHSTWRALPAMTYASRWHELFAGASGDARAALTWRGRLTRALPAAVNFFSPGEEILAAPEAGNASMVALIVRQGFAVTRGSWVMQEFAKGASLGDSLAALVFSRLQAGWGPSVHYWPGFSPSPDPRLEPYFAPFLEADLLHRDPVRASAAANRRLVQYDVLARGIPALSFGTALQPLDPLGASRNLNLEQIGRVPDLWPDEPRGFDHRNYARWLHSDFRAVALPYVAPLYRQILLQARLLP